MNELGLKTNWRGQLILQVKVPAYVCLACKSSDVTATCQCKVEYWRDAKLTDVTLNFQEKQP